MSIQTFFAHMLMARHVLFLASVFTVVMANAQFVVGNCHSGKDMKAEDRALLAGTTTIFFYRTGDAQRADEWKKAIQEAWTLTPIEIHSITEMGDFKERMTVPSGYSFMTLESSWTMMDNFVPTISLVLWVPSEEPQYFYTSEYQKRQPFMRLLMDADIATLDFALSHNFKNAFGPYLYSEAPLPFWKPFIIADMLRRASADLEDGVCYNSMVKSAYDKAERNKLRESTLYICESSLGQWGYKDKRLQFINERAEVLEAYERPKSVITEDELDHMLSDPAQPPFYFLLTAHKEYLCVLTIWKSQGRGAVTSSLTAGHQLDKGYKRLK